MAIVRSADPAALTVGEARDQARTARRRYLRRWLPIGIGLLMAAAMVVMAAAAPLIAPLSPSAQFSDAVLKGPGVVERHLLGTDEFGRDILSRIIWGARVSLQIGLASVLWSFVLGVPLGILAGVRGGKIETLIMRGADM
jgi:peptide/nickel transport system permease protein